MHRAPRALAALAVLIFAADGRAGSGSLEVWFIDIGQGDAAFATTPGDRTLLVDAGPPGSAGRLARFLRPRVAGPIDAVVLTHPHADHVGGMLAALKIAGARHFYDPVLGHPSPIVDAVYRWLEPRTRAGQTVAHRVRAGRTEPVDFGDGARLEFLAPEDPLLYGTRSDANANSVVCRLSLGEVAILFAADAEPGTEARLLRRHAGSLRAAVLKVPHHGGERSAGRRFLAAVAPRVAVVTVGPDNGYGHPAGSTLARIESAGVRLLRTDRDGTIHLKTDGRSLEVTPAGGPR